MIHIEIVTCTQHLVFLSCAIRSPTFFHNRVSFRSVDFLTSDDVTRGVGKVNELTSGVEVQSSGVHQILYRDHVLIWNLGVHVHPPDDPRATFTVEQEKLVLGLWETTRAQDYDITMKRCTCTVIMRDNCHQTRLH